MRLYVSFYALSAPLAAIAATGQSGGQYSPSFSPVYLIAWWICNGRKRNPIGGWLLFFYWGVYSGILVSCGLFAANIQSYVPENFDSSTKFLMVLASTVPSMLLFCVRCTVATLLLSARTWDMLKLLRCVLMAELAAGALASAIDVVYFPDNVALSFLVRFPAIGWLIYLYRSKRVRHVFLLRDWDIAVDSIYPAKLTMAA